MSWVWYWLFYLLHVVEQTHIDVCAQKLHPCICKCFESIRHVFRLPALVLSQANFPLTVWATQSFKWHKVKNHRQSDLMRLFWDWMSVQVESVWCRTARTAWDRWGGLKCLILATALLRLVTNTMTVSEIVIPYTRESNNITSMRYRIYLTMFLYDTASP